MTQEDKSNWAEAVRELRDCLGKEKKNNGKERQEGRGEKPRKLSCLTTALQPTSAGISNMNLSIPYHKVLILGSAPISEPKSLVFASSGPGGAVDSA